MTGHIHHDDAHAVMIFNGFHAQFQSQIHNGNDFPPQIDHPLDVFRHLRHGTDRLHMDDFTHIQHGNTIAFFGQFEDDVFALPGRFDQNLVFQADLRGGLRADGNLAFRGNLGNHLALVFRHRLCLAGIVGKTRIDKLFQIDDLADTHLVFHETLNNIKVFHYRIQIVRCNAVGISQHSMQKG